MTPLILSIINGHHQISKILIDNGCIAITVDNSGHMASHQAIQQSNNDILDVLIKNGAHETKDILILNSAVENDNLDLIKLLMNKKYNKHIDLNRKSDKDGLSPLQYSIVVNN